MWLLSLLLHVFKLVSKALPQRTVAAAINLYFVLLNLRSLIEDELNQSPKTTAGVTQCLSSMLTNSDPSPYWWGHAASVNLWDRGM